MTKLTDGFCLKPFHVSVFGFPPAFYAARTRQQAIARAWRSYLSYRDIEFRDFLKIASATKTVAPQGFGDAIVVSGLPAFKVSGEPGVNNYVTFVRPGCDQLLYSHPLDVSSAGRAALDRLNAMKGESDA